MRAAERERGTWKEKCRSEKVNERIVQKIHSEQPVVTKQ